MTTRQIAIRLSLQRNAKELAGLMLTAALGACGGREEGSLDVAAASGASGPPSYARDAANDSWPAIQADARPEVTPEAIGAANYYVVLDGSGSMRDSKCSGSLTKIEAAVVALQRFVDAVPADANLGLAVFDDSGISERVPLGTGNRDVFQGALSAVVAAGRTPLHSSIELGFERLTVQARRQLGYGEYHLVVVTDGVPDPRSEDPTTAIERIWASSPVVLHTIGFCIGENHVLNRPGRSYYVAADSAEQLQEGLGSVLAEAPSFYVARFGDD